MTGLKFDSVGFIGAGNMASAIATGMINTGLIKAEHILLSAPSDNNLLKFRQMGCKTTLDNGDVVREKQIVFLAMKPQYLDHALETFPKTDFGVKLVVSMLAGVTIESIQRKLSDLSSDYNKVSVVRIMPNTPAAVGEGVILISCSKSCRCRDDDDCRTVKLIMSGNGLCEFVSEANLNSLGALCGSGPAFIYIMAEALADGAVRTGAPRDLATRLAAQTIRGAAKMILDSGKHPAQLKDEVCSPGGTTIAGVHAMESGGVRAALMNAIVATKARADELSKLA